MKPLLQYFQPEAKHSLNAAGVFKSALLAALFLTMPGAAPRESKTPAGRDYASFKLIGEKNIFNASRASRQSSNRRAEAAPASQVETITLVGTLSYGKGPYAFFDSTKAEYRTVLETGKSIAGFKIAEITNTGVKLEGNNETIDLSVGMQLRREEGQPWKLTARDGAATTVATASEGDSPDASSSSGSGEESDIIKKLMQQREQELK